MRVLVHYPTTSTHGKVVTVNDRVRHITIAKPVTPFVLDTPVEDFYTPIELIQVPIERFYFHQRIYWIAVAPGSTARAIADTLLDAGRPREIEADRRA